MEPHVPITKAFTLLRGQRHSFLNHFQVISGWLQLDQPDRARQYLDAVAAHMAEEADLVRALPPDAGLWVLQLMLEAESSGVEVQWQLSDHAGQVTEAAWHQVSGALRNAASQPEGKRRLLITAEPDGRIHIHTHSGQGEG